MQCETRFTARCRPHLTTTLNVSLRNHFIYSQRQVVSETPVSTVHSLRSPFASSCFCTVSPIVSAPFMQCCEPSQPMTSTQNPSVNSSMLYSVGISPKSISVGVPSSGQHCSKPLHHGKALPRHLIRHLSALRCMLCRLSTDSSFAHANQGVVQHLNAVSQGNLALDVGHIPSQT